MDKCVVVNQIMYKLPSMEIIPQEYMIYQKVPKDGYYKIYLGNCGRDDCKPGSYPQKCIDNKCISKKKCAVYCVESIVDKVSIVIDGFNNKDSAQAFINWYSGSGEQDSEAWLEEEHMNNKLVNPRAYIDSDIKMRIEEKY